MKNYRSWIRKNLELTEFLQIQLPKVVYFILPIPFNVDPDYSFARLLD